MDSRIPDAKVEAEKICQHESLEYALGNTYCAVCGDWLYAGKPALSVKEGK